MASIREGEFERDSAVVDEKAFSDAEYAERLERLRRGMAGGGRNGGPRS